MTGDIQHDKDGRMKKKEGRDRVEDIRLIAADLDGTLLNADSEVSSRTAEVLKRAKEAGVILAAATGRPYDSLPETVRSSESIEYAITSNGSGIYHMRGRKRLYANTMSMDTVERLLKLLAEYPCPLEVYIDGTPYAEDRYLDDPTAYGLSGRSAEYVKATRHACDDIPALLHDHADCVDGIDIVETDQQLKDEIRARARDIPDLYITASLSHYLEFAAGSVSKETALRELVRMLGIERSQVMCFGDGENDSEMLQYAGTGVAMGNASEQLKDLADRITESNLEDGVARAIERWVL
jgi:Cof subfamily protein (haloacid dehalogenase superfamily)